MFNSEDGANSVLVMQAETKAQLTCLVRSGDKSKFFVLILMYVSHITFNHFGFNHFVRVMY